MASQFTLQSLAKHTTLRVGPAVELIEPDNTDEIIAVLKEYKNNLRVIGNGSNLLVLDSAKERRFMKISERYGNYSLEGTSVIAQSGIMLSRLQNKLVNAGLGGLEMTIGVPTTLGGAIVGNFGAYGSEISERIEWVKFADGNGKIRTLPAAKLRFAYRDSIFKHKRSTFVILEAKIKFSKMEPTLIKDNIKDYRNRRTKSTPRYPNAGSIFRNPPGNNAGKLIQQLGIPDLLFGGARFWDQHANWLINTKDATPEDCLDLIRFAKMEVESHYGINLQTEIRIID